MDTAHLVKGMVTHLMERGVDPVASKVSEEDFNMCWDILETAYRKAEKQKDESHLYPRQVMEGAKHLKKSGVTCEDVSRMTGAICLLDSVSSATIRRQDKRKILAKNTFADISNGRHLADILSSFCKDDVHLMKTEGGMSVIHRKHASIQKAYAILVVLGRALFRLEGFFLDPCDQRQ